MQKPKQCTHLEKRKRAAEAGTQFQCRRDGKRKTSPGFWTIGVTLLDVRRVEEVKTPQQRDWALRRTGDIAIGGCSGTGERGLSRSRNSFSPRQDPVPFRVRIRDRVVNCTVPLRETRSTAAPSMRLPEGGDAGSIPAGGTISTIRTEEATSVPARGRSKTRSATGFGHVAQR